MRSLLALVLVAFTAAVASAHFPFIVPEASGKADCKVVFSDSLDPDKAKYIEKIAKAEFYAHTGGKSVKVTTKSVTEGEDGWLALTCPSDKPTWVTASLAYGVISKGKEPYRLVYNTKAVAACKPGESLPPSPDMKSTGFRFDVLPDLKASTVKVTFDGKAVADAEVVVKIPGAEKADLKTDKDGVVKLPAAKANGFYVIRAKHADGKKGAADGKEYAETRTYCVCVVPAAAATSGTR